MEPLDQYLHGVVMAADRIAEATRTEDLTVIYREFDRAVSVPVPGDVYDPRMALLTAQAAQVDIKTTRQADRLAWAAKCRPLDPFLRGALPQIATGVAATVRNADREAITPAFHRSLETVAISWPDPFLALSVTLGMQTDTEVSACDRIAWTLKPEIVELRAAA